MGITGRSVHFVSNRTLWWLTQQWKIVNHPEARACCCCCFFFCIYLLRSQISNKCPCSCHILVICSSQTSWRACCVIPWTSLHHVTAADACSVMGAAMFHHIPQGKRLHRCGKPMKKPEENSIQMVDFPHLNVSLPLGNIFGQRGEA